MAIELVVTQPFAVVQPSEDASKPGEAKSYSVGDVITGGDMDAAQKASPHCVVRRAAAEKPAETAPASAPAVRT